MSRHWILKAKTCCSASDGSFTINPSGKLTDRDSLKACVGSQLSMALAISSTG